MMATSAMFSPVSLRPPTAGDRSPRPTHRARRSTGTHRRIGCVDRAGSHDPARRRASSSSHASWPAGRVRSLTPLPPLRRLTRSSRLRAAGSGEDLETALNRSFSGTSEKSTGDAELATLELLHGLILRPNPSAPNVTVSYSMDDVLGGDGEMVNEFQDSGGNEFTVVLTNVDAPQGLTKLEVVGIDRVNLLGAMCSALSKMEVSIVSGLISTAKDGVVRNTMYVRRSDGYMNRRVGGKTHQGDDCRRISEDDFASVSFNVAAACWTSDRREWLASRPAGKFLSGGGATRAARVAIGDQAQEREELAAAEARMRAASARLADAAKKPVDLFGSIEAGVNDELVTEMQDALEAVSKARRQLAKAIALGGASGDSDVKESPGVLQGLYDALPPFVKGVLLMNVSSMLFGSNQVVIKQVANAGLDDFSQLFFRFGLALIPLLPFLAKALQSKQRKEMTEAAFQLGSILAIGYLLQTIGLDNTTSARGALTSTFTVLSVPVFAGMAGQVVPWYTWPASCMGLVGVGLLTNSGGDPTIGDAICILSACAFGYHTLRSSDYAALFEDQELSFIALQVTVVVMEAGLFKIGEVIVEALDGDIDLATYLATVPDQLAAVPWAPLAYMGFCTTSFCLFIEFLALQNVSASLAALIYTAEPLWGAVFAWQFMGDRWGPSGWVGASLIIGASLGSQLLSYRETNQEESTA